jgi:hypothetical protein
MGLAALELGKRTPHQRFMPIRAISPSVTIRSKMINRAVTAAWIYTVRLHNPVTPIITRLANDMGVDMIHDFMKPRFRPENRYRSGA